MNASLAVTRASAADVADGDKVTVATGRGAVTLPVEVVPMADHVVWLPTAGLARAGVAAELPPYPAEQDPAIPAGSTVRAQLGAGHGATVTLRRPE